MHPRLRYRRDMAGFDLHTHSTFSDGTLEPEQVVELAATRDLTGIALTDHDTTEGVERARKAAAGTGLEVLLGCELSAEHQGAGAPQAGPAPVHVLGYGFDPAEPVFASRRAWILEGRVGRARRMVERLRALGADVHLDRVLELAGSGSVGRPHVAQALLEAGHVRSMPEAFDRFLANGGPAYVERQRFGAAESVALIHSVGGLAILAHPIESRGAEALIPELAASAGLDGVECYYQGYPPEAVERLVAVARAHGLVPSGGSDYHGFPLSGMTAVANEPGSVPIPPEVLGELRERRRQRFG
jgi:3',5'-nucleoside bisphosphate phosphatase